MKSIPVTATLLPGKSPSDSSFSLGCYFKTTSYFALTAISHIGISANIFSVIVTLSHLIGTAVESQNSYAAGEVPGITEFLKIRA